MKTTITTCNNCGKQFNKPTNEYNRRIRLNRPMYCSIKCAGKYNINNLKDRSKWKRIYIPSGNLEDPFNYYIRNSKRRTKHKFDLTVDYLKEIWENQKGICPYSKINLVLRSYTKNKSNFYNLASLDRIDSSKGYVKGNVQFVALPINYMKNTLSHTQTIEFITILTKNNSNFLEDRTISSSNKMLDALGSP